MQEPGANCSESRRLQLLLDRLWQELRGGGGGGGGGGPGPSASSRPSARPPGEDDAYLYILLIMIFYGCLAGGLILAYTRSRKLESKHDPYHLYIESDWAAGKGVPASPGERSSSGDSEPLQRLGCQHVFCDELWRKNASLEVSAWCSSWHFLVPPGQLPGLDFVQGGGKRLQLHPEADLKMQRMLPEGCRCLSAFTITDREAVCLWRRMQVNICLRQEWTSSTFGDCTGMLDFRKLKHPIAPKGHPQDLTIKTKAGLSSMA
ncbi:hypothetical protein Chor_004440 [Crotalus horridus]